MRLIILDRDGVINEDSDDYIKSAQELIPIPGSIEAIASLHQAGFQIVIATNQSGLGRGLFDIEALNQMHTKLHMLTNQAGGKIEAIFFCPHKPDDKCTCRKPKPGLLLDIGQRLQTNLSDVPFIGDSYRDIQAGIAAGCKPMLVMTGKGKDTLAKHHQELLEIPIYENLSVAARALIQALPQP